MRHYSIVLSVVTMSVLAGCNSNPVAPTPTPEIVQDDTEQGLNNFRAQWEAEGPDNYDVGIYQRCVCVQNLILYNVQVRNGIPVSATKTSSTEQNEPVSVEEVPYPTIDALFDLIQYGFDVEADSVGVRYETNTGRPDRISIDHVILVADDEINAYVDSFEEQN